MPGSCVVPKCKSNYRNGSKMKVYRFPTDPGFRKKWILAIKRANFTPTPHSRVCELHFKDTDFITTASGVHDKTGELIVVGLKHRRIRPDAIPNIFSSLPGSALINSSPRESPNSEKAATGQNFIAQNVEHKDGNTSTGTESQNVAEPSIVIKQELVESTDESPPLVIDNVLCVKELVPFSSNLSLSSSSPASSSLPPSNSSLPPSNSSSPPSGSSPLFISSSPFPENALPVANPDSTNVDETIVRNKPERKRKINDAKPDAIDSTPSATRTKLHRLAKPPILSKRIKRISKPHPPSRGKKTSGRSISLTKDSQNAAREIFQSLMNDSENIPLFGSPTRERPGDLFDVFADCIAEKIREMKWDSCAFALRSILNIVFAAGQVQRSSEEDSDISNSDTSSSSEQE